MKQIQSRRFLVHAFLLGTIFDNTVVFFVLGGSADSTTSHELLFKNHHHHRRSFMEGPDDDRLLRNGTTDSSQQKQPRSRTNSSSSTGSWTVSPPTTTSNNRTNQTTTNDERIVGGRPVPVDAYPYYVHTLEPILCGGTLIHPDIVLTAAHCQGGFAAGALVGGTLLSGADAEFFNVKLECGHADFSSVTQFNDIMLVKLSDSSDAPLAPLGFDITVPQQGDVTTVMGFGTTASGGTTSDVLLEVEVDVFSDTFCFDLYVYYDIDTMVCAGSEEGGRDSCQGDSGGPLLSSDGNQVGIVSSGSGCGVSNTPALYTHVAAFESFIRQGICELSDNPPLSCQDLLPSSPLACLGASQPAISPVMPPVPIMSLVPVPLPMIPINPPPSPVLTIPTRRPTLLTYNPTVLTYEPIATLDPTYLPTSCDTYLPTTANIFKRSMKGGMNGAMKMTMSNKNKKMSKVDKKRRGMGKGMMSGKGTMKIRRMGGKAGRTFLNDDEFANGIFRFDISNNRAAQISLP